MPHADPSLSPDARLRAELAALLRGGNAHVHTRAALDGIPPDRVNDRVHGLPYSLWELVEHLRFTQRDILDFVRDPNYDAPPWPQAYWPEANEATPAIWSTAIDSFLDDLDTFVILVENEATDLFAELPWAPGYTVLREALLAADHNAHHLGQVIALRRQLGLWPA